MSAYLITGFSGSGKSTVAHELARMGYAAYDTDDMRDITRHFDMELGRYMNEAPPAPIDYYRYSWMWDVPALKALINQPAPVFIAAITSNTEENLHLFDQVFYLDADWHTLEHRLLTRTTNDFGKHPDELADLKKDFPKGREFWLNKSTVIDSTQPVALIAKDILAHAKNESVA